MNTALSIEQVSHWYGDRQVLFDISLNVPRGSITAVIGPSGQGKTTLLRIIGGFEVPRNGVVRIGERVVNEQGKCLIPSERRGVSRSTVSTLIGWWKCCVWSFAKARHTGKTACCRST